MTYSMFKIISQKKKKCSNLKCLYKVQLPFDCLLKVFVQISTTIWLSFNRSKYLNLIVIWTRFNQLEVTFELPFRRGFINQKSSQTSFNFVMLAVVYTPFHTYNLTLKKENMIILYTQKSLSNLVNNSFITYYENARFSDPDRSLNRKRERFKGFKVELRSNRNRTVMTS